MKNLPARVRAHSRVASGYARHGKTAYSYPAWARSAHRGGYTPEWLRLELAQARDALKASRAKEARPPARRGG